MGNETDLGPRAEGSIACQNGVPREANPYSGPKAIQWEMGWKESHDAGWPDDTQHEAPEREVPINPMIAQEARAYLEDAVPKVQAAIERLMEASRVTQADLDREVCAPPEQDGERGRPMTDSELAYCLDHAADCFEPGTVARRHIVEAARRLRSEVQGESEPAYCLDCGHPPAYHRGYGHCSATMIAQDGEEYPCGCKSERHFLGRDTALDTSPEQGPPEVRAPNIYQICDGSTVAIEIYEPGQRDVHRRLFLTPKEARKLENCLRRYLRTDGFVEEPPADAHQEGDGG